MAVRSSKSQKAPEVNTKNTQQTTNTNVPLFDLFKQFETRNVSIEAEKFVETIGEHVDKTKDINVEFMTDRNKNIILKYDKNVVFIILQDNLINEGIGGAVFDRILKYEDFNKNVASLRNYLKDGDNLVNVLIATETHYNNPAITFNIARSILEQHAHPLIKDLNIEQFRDVTFVIEADVNKAKEYLSRHGYFDSRADFGLVIYGIQGKFADVQSAINSKNAFPLGAITGFLSFIGGPINMVAQQPMMYGGIMPSEKFVPIIRISDVASVVKTSSILPLLLTVAIIGLVGKGMWRKFIPKHIGYLIKNPDNNKPLEITNDNDLQTFMNIYCYPNPVVAIDANVGLSPMTNYIAYYGAQFDQLFNKFFNIQAANIFGHDMCEITGIVYDKTKIIDSRYIDYFTFVKNFGYSEDFKAKFIWTNNPIEKAKLIAERYTFKPITKCEIKIFNNTIVDVINAANINVLTTYEAFVPTIDFNKIAQMGLTGFMSNPAFVNVPTGFRPMI